MTNPTSNSDIHWKHFVDKTGNLLNDSTSLKTKNKTNKDIVNNKIKLIMTRVLSKKLKISEDKICIGLKNNIWFLKLVGKNFSRFDPDINRESIMIAMAKEAALENFKNLSKNIKNYGISDQKSLFEIAKIAATQNGKEVMLNIEEYGIKNETYLFEIAKIVAAQSGVKIAVYIEDFGIKNETYLFEIAKIAAAQNGRTTSMFIEGFGIKNEKYLFEIAKVAAEQDGQGVSEHIKKYGIKNEKYLFEIAKVAAEQDGQGVSEHIKKYGIKNEKYLFEIVRIAAAQDGRGVSAFIKKYGIKKEEYLFELAKINAAQNGQATSMFIENFGIKNETYLFEIAKIAAAQNGQATSIFISRYGIKDTQMKLKILVHACTQSIDLLQYCQKYGFNDMAEAMHEMEKYISNVFLGKADFLLKKIKTENSLRIQQELLVFLACTAEILSNQSCSSENLTWLIDSNILNSITEYRDMKMRKKLITILVDSFTRDQKLILRHGQLMDGKNTRYLLPSLLLNILEKRGVSESMPEFHHIIDLMQDKTMKDKKKQKQLIESLYSLCTEKVFSNSDIRFLIKVVFPSMNFKHIIKVDGTKKSQTEIKQEKKAFKKQFDINTSLFLSIVKLDESSRLKQESLKGQNGGMESVIQQAIQEKIPGDFENIVNFSEKFHKTLGLFRRNDAIYSYASSLGQADDDRYLKAYGEYLISVINGGFKKLRYDSKKSTHLQTVFEGREELASLWMQGDSQNLESLISSQGTPDETIIDFNAILLEKIATDNHLDPMSNNLLVNFLNVHQEEEKRTIYNNLLKELKLLEGTEKKVKDQFLLQKFCMELVLAKDENHFEKLIRIKRHLKRMKKSLIDFENDIQGFILEQEALKKRKSFEKWKIVDTDDPCDLLLCGTEVEGSCQRVDNSSSFNKCLLSYLLDGKNRLIAIKNPEGKIIARLIFRILWDSQKETPVLFQERIYPQILASELKNALENMAKQRADTLGLRLVGSYGKKAYSGTVESLGGIAPSEYVDAEGKGVVDGSRYIIHSSYHL